MHVSCAREEDGLSLKDIYGGGAPAWEGGQRQVLRSSSARLPGRGGYTFSLVPWQSSTNLDLYI